MPIVINEIQIITSVTEKPAGNNPSSSAESSKPNASINKKEKQQIITECIEEVMRILKDKKDR